MKLEAVDKKNPTFVCVATVTDMVDNRFLVHFDNWDESYDYWYVVFDMYPSEMYQKHVSFKQYILKYFPDSTYSCNTNFSWICNCGHHSVSPW